jgi:ankyrin repeat protein
MKANEQLIRQAEKGELTKVRKLLISTKLNVDAPGEDRQEGYTALMASSYFGHLDIVKILLKYGAKINRKNYDGYTALSLASSRGNLDIVKYLVSKRAKINITDYEEKTALFKAINNTHLNTVKYLVSKGAKINITDYEGNTPLMLASRFHGNLNTVKYLVSKGAKINIINDYGETALFKAVYGDRLQVVKYLVSKGAKINITDNDGKTMLIYALEKGYKKIYSYLSKLILEPTIKKKLIRQKDRETAQAFTKGGQIIPQGMRGEIFKYLFGKTPNSLKDNAKKYGIRLTVNRNGKRVYKSEKVLKKQIKNSIKRKLRV